MPRVPRSIPKKPGPYHAQPAVQPLIYRAPPRAPPTDPTPLPPKGPTPAQKAERARRPAFYFGSALAFGIGVYCTALYVSSTKTTCSHADHSPTTQKDVAYVYDDTASSFDAEVGTSEYLMGITKARKALARQCKGDVLEVSAGTGRNLGYYRFASDGVKSLTLVDLSAQMVETAKVKWGVLNKGDRVKGVRFMKGDAASEMPPPPPMPVVVFKDEKSAAKGAEVVMREGGKRGYDTIIQTMGLCSCPSPVQLLKNLVGHLDTNNPESRILLLEHGRSYYQWLNNILDSQAPQHADQHGCWWNRDIGEIVEQSGLEVVRERRKHFGTTWIYELKPKQSQVKSLKEKAGVKAGEAVEDVKDVATEVKKDVSLWLPKWS